MALIYVCLFVSINSIVLINRIHLRTLIQPYELMMVVIEVNSKLLSIRSRYPCNVCMYLCVIVYCDTLKPEIETCNVHRTFALRYTRQRYVLLINVRRHLRLNDCDCNSAHGDHVRDCWQAGINNMTYLHLWTDQIKQWISLQSFRNFNLPSDLLASCRAQCGHLFPAHWTSGTWQFLHIRQ